MNRHLHLAIAAVMLSIASIAVATPLTPQQALKAARTQQAKGMMKAPSALSAEMDLAYTMTENGAPTVYVFANPEGQPGFMIVAADDVARPVLGYSEDTAFDPANIPSGLRCWLENASYSVERLAADPTFAEQSNLSAVSYQSTTRRAARPSIAPICATQWNQGSPYSNDCPVLGSRRAVTGCVATAMAQVMKVYNYPAKGTGSKSYTFKYNNVTYTQSFNFDENPFDWDNMLNRYPTSSSGTAVQKSAVARLMHACGVASEMEYSPDGSGAVTEFACAAMIQYFNYDKAMTFEERAWYYLREWNNLVYSQLALGRPVMYSGVDSSNAGHCFVCDGYSAADYFHINWGWGGTSDGYFLLSDLNPDQQGTGGGSGDSGFVNYSGALIGCQPAVEGSKLVPRFAVGTKWDTSSHSITRSSSSSVVFTGGFFNYSLGSLSGSLGCKIVDANNTVSYVSLGSFTSLDQLYGYTTLSVNSTKFPVGQLKVYPVYMPMGTSTWLPMMYDKENTNEYLIFNVTASKITVTVPSPTPDPGDASVDPVYSYTGSVPAETDGALYQGVEYTLNFNAIVSGIWKGKLICRLSNNTTTVTSDPVNVSYDAVKNYDQAFTLKIPADLPTGEYVLSVLKYNESTKEYEILDYATKVSVDILPLRSTATTVSITPDENPGGAYPRFYQKGQYKLVYDLNVNKAWSGALRCHIFKRVQNRYTSLYASEEVPVTFTEAGTQRKEFEIEVPLGIAAGTYFMALAYTNEDGYMSFFGGNVQISIAKAPDPAGEVVSLMLDGVTLNADSTYYVTDDSQLSINLTCTVGPWSPELQGQIFSESMKLLWFSPYATTTLQTGEKGTIDFVMPWKEMAEGTFYLLNVGDNKGNTLTPSYRIARTVSSLDIITAPTDVDDAKYYNLQGAPVSHPEAGIYIMISNGQARKVLVK